MSLTNWQFVPDDGLWLALDLPPELEMMVGGDSDAPNPHRVKLAERVFANIESITTKAIAFLKTAIKNTEFEGCSEWNLLTTHLGESPDEPLNEFVVMMTLEDDTYGLWKVRFRFHSNGFEDFIPISSRRDDW